MAAVTAGRTAPNPPARIMVYGVTGSGKTTLARQIADRTGLPCVLIDDLTWQPGWVAVPADEQRRLIADVCDGDRWVIDHGYGAWIDLPLARADLIVALDYPRLLSLTRLLRRCFVNLVTRRTLCNGNTESMRNLLARDSIVWWHFTSYRRKRRRMRAWLADPDAPPVLLFSRPHDATAWVKSLGETPAGAPPPAA
jgi:adenylate kinase family enzyme